MELRVLGGVTYPHNTPVTHTDADKDHRDALRPDLLPLSSLTGNHPHECQTISLDKHVSLWTKDEINQDLVIDEKRWKHPRVVPQMWAMKAGGVTVTCNVFPFPPLDEIHID